MKILFKNRKTIEFVSGLTDLSANSDMVQILEVEFDVPLNASRETLWVKYQSADNSFDATHELLVANNYTEEIPVDVIRIGGEWKLQLFIREYDTVTGTFVTRATSDPAMFTFPESLQLNADGTPITNATVAALYHTAVETIKEATDLKNIYASVKKLTEENEKAIKILQYDKVNKAGDTMTGPLKVKDGDFWIVLNKDSVQVVDSESMQLTELRVGKIINRSDNQETGDYNADIKLPEQSGVLVLDSELARVENFLERRIDFVEGLADELAASILTKEQVDSLF